MNYSLKDRQRKQLMIDEVKYMTSTFDSDLMDWVKKNTIQNLE
jgi:hypothetical protein